MFSPLSVLPLHLACQMLASENSSSAVNVNINTTRFPKLITELPSGYIILPEFGAAYKYFNYKVRWDVARKYCIRDGGNLVVVDSYEKLAYVMDINKSGTHLHVGFHKLFDDVEWTDVKTGLPALSIPWRADPLHGVDRKCTVVLGDKSGIVACTCPEAYTFVCEISMFRD